MPECLSRYMYLLSRRIMDSQAIATIVRFTTADMTRSSASTGTEAQRARTFTHIPSERRERGSRATPPAIVHEDDEQLLKGRRPRRDSRIASAGSGG